jgi:hypothetical protein
MKPDRIVEILERNARALVERRAQELGALGALHILKTRYDAGEYERAFTESRSLELDRYAGPRFGIHYGWLRAALELVAERFRENDRAGVDAFVAEHGGTVTELIRTIAPLKEDDYLEHAADDDWDYVDVLRHDPNLLPGDPGVGEWREEVSLVERIARDSSSLSRDGAATLAAWLATAARPPRGDT